MRKITRILIFFNVSAFLINYILLMLNKITYNMYDFSSQLIIFLSISMSLYIYLKSTLIQWFGKNVEVGSYANIVVGNIISLICLQPAIFFNFYPILKLLLVQD